MENKNFKLFDKYETEGVEIKDPSLKPYISFGGLIVAKYQGRRKFDKFVNAKINIVERLSGRLGVPGHIGKKHKIMTNWGSGKYWKNMQTVLEALDIIAKKTGSNPLQVLISAVENCSPRDEITVIEHAGARYPQAVDCSPMRRVNLAIRWITQGAYQKAFGKKKKMSQSLADEIMLAFQKNMESYSMQKKNEAEKQADAAR